MMGEKPDRMYASTNSGQNGRNLAAPFPRTSGDIELRVSPDLSQLSVPRAVAGTVAAHNEFDLDRISDIEIFVDEMVSILIQNAVSGIVVLKFSAKPAALIVRGEATCTATTKELGSAFGWQVMRTLSDGLNAGFSESEISGAPATAFFEAEFLLAPA